ncbi:MAG: hypothetical protein HYU64_21380 [Armatimonadetes bacterium]|nr:hypothetical protein [Armatimonadota bacterium]
MDIPEYFLEKATRQFGDLGPAWVRELPLFFTRCQDKWRLSECRFIDDLSINLVCYAKSEQYGEVVLKIQGPHAERSTEIVALQLYNGRHSCRLHAVDTSIPAMLLERILPGSCLKSLEDKDKQLEIGISMISDLPIPLKADNGLPNYSTWLDNATTRMYREFKPDSTMKSLLTIARGYYEDIEPQREPLALLHGDLHHENILRRGDRDWVAIDPQGVVGAAFLEAGRFLQNHVIPEEEPIRLDETAAAIAAVAKGLRKPWHRIAKTLFILHLLSLCWNCEMRQEPRMLDIEKQQCLQIIELIKGY